MRENRAGAAVAGGEVLCVMLGLLVPSLLGYCVIRHVGRRAVFAAGVLVIGVAVTALSAALSWGPAHAWGWLDEPVRVGVWAAAGMAVLLLMLPRRASAAVLLVALVWHLALLNQAPTNVYFAQTLMQWGRGASSVSMAWASGWAGSGLMWRCCMCWCASRAKTPIPKIPP